MNFEVQGHKIKCEEKKLQPLFFPMSYRKFFKVEEEETHDEDNEDKEPQIKECVRKISKKNKKDNALKEILNLRNIHKKKKEEERHIFPLNCQTYPSLLILMDIYKTKKQPIEEMKKYMMTQPKKESKIDFLDMADLDSFLSKAYYELYEEHLSNVKDIIYRLHSSPKMPKEKPVNQQYEGNIRVSSAPN